MKKGDDVLEIVNFIKDRMVTKDDLDNKIDDLRTELKNDIRRVEMKVDSVEKRLDYELDQRNGIEHRVTKLEIKTARL